MPDSSTPYASHNTPNQPSDTTSQAMKIHIQGGRLIDPASNTDAAQDLYIAAGKIVGVGSAPADFTANKIIDAKGLIVCPGLVDLSARLREPGYEYKATLESEVAAATAGGVTSLVCPPDTDPVLDEPGLVEMLKFRARTLNQTHVYPLGALTLGLKGETLTEMGQLTEAGCVGFSQAEAPVRNTQVLLRALQYAQTFGFTVWLRPEDPFLGGGVAASGAVASRLGLSGVSVIAETVRLHTIFELMRSTGARVHLCRLSSAAGLELVRQAKREGLKVTCDVNIHHVSLTDMDIGYFNSQMRFSPPLRSPRDRDAIVAALADGTIDALCSDHTPVDDDEKLLPFAEASPGATGLELLLPLTLRWASEHKVPLAQALARITAEPARVIGLKAGTLAVGRAADVCVFDPRQVWKVERRSLKSQGKNSPWLGYEMEGKVRMTLVGGQVVYGNHAQA
ncbi:DIHYDROOROTASE, Carbamoylaspartic dehydrase [Cupriavidus taiwanensis]|nr:DIHYDROOROTASE, Carbamoylaspartic dehydrase [Cupriavidus taiwanensis]SOZ79232.1 DIHYDROOROTASE, Carbamoylaspartic dehydrase [Cupriavidus taiwanensis]SOZ79829.1 DIHYDROOROTASE, Carbamoylaspartic dehydrase [Cupriavidus taiwanensis]SOZ87394.1 DIHYDROOROTASE, Carbamoylaspartic dehydrase [Cupriavidus taiwanensis]